MDGVQSVVSSRPGFSQPTLLVKASAGLRHEMGRWHPESPERLTAIEDQMIASGVAGLVVHEEAPFVEDEDLLRVHEAAHLERLRALSPAAGYAAVDADTLMSAGTLEAARQAAGAAVMATDAVIAGRARNAFCCIRPPGHHATRAQAMGFCFFNNVAVGAMRALQVHGLSRVAIVDFDVHHGNGTEDALMGQEQVLMVSFFQHPFYPYSGENGSASNMLNLPVAAGTDGSQIRDLVTSTWLPALEQFKPEMIFISAGFDAHRDDDLGGMRLIEADYVWLTETLMAVARRHSQDRIVSCLEGGYNLGALGRSATAHVKTLATA